MTAITFLSSIPPGHNHVILLYLHTSLLPIISVRVANSKAEIKPTAPLSVFDKENSMEFSFNSLLLIHFTTVAMHLLSHSPHVTLVMWHSVTVTCDLTICDHLSHYCDIVTKSRDTFPHSIL